MKNVITAATLAWFHWLLKTSGRYFCFCIVWRLFIYWFADKTQTTETRLNDHNMINIVTKTRTEHNQSKVFDINNQWCVFKILLYFIVWFMWIWPLNFSRAFFLIFNFLNFPETHIYARRHIHAQTPPCDHWGSKQPGVMCKQLREPWFLHACPLSNWSFIFFPSTLISGPKIRLAFYKELSAEGHSVPLM